MAIKGRSVDVLFKDNKINDKVIISCLDEHQKKLSDLIT